MGAVVSEAESIAVQGFRDKLEAALAASVGVRLQVLNASEDLAAQAKRLRDFAKASFNESGRRRPAFITCILAVADPVEPGQACERIEVVLERSDLEDRNLLKGHLARLAASKTGSVGVAFLVWAELLAHLQSGLEPATAALGVPVKA